MNNFTYYFILIFILFNGVIVNANEEVVPNLVGTWVGKNNTLSEQRGYRTWEKKSRNHRTKG